MLDMTATKPLSQISGPAADQGALGAATDMLRGRWKFVILWHLLAGELKFADLCRCMPDAAPRALHQQLQDLELHGLILRSINPQAPASLEYAISPLGRTLEPIILALEDWGERYDGRNYTAARQADLVRTATGPSTRRGQAGTPGFWSNGRRA